MRRRKSKLLSSQTEPELFAVTAAEKDNAAAAADVQSKHHHRFVACKSYRLSDDLSKMMTDTVYSRNCTPLWENAGKLPNCPVHGRWNLIENDSCDDHHLHLLLFVAAEEVVCHGKLPTRGKSRRKKENFPAWKTRESRCELSPCETVMRYYTSITKTM